MSDTATTTTATTTTALPPGYVHGCSGPMPSLAPSAIAAALPPSWKPTALELARLAACCTREDMTVAEFVDGCHEYADVTAFLAALTEAGCDTAPPEGMPVVAPEPAPVVEQTATSRQRVDRMAKLLEQYEEACGQYARAATKQQLRLGKLGTQYLRVRLSGEKDLGVIRASRAQGVNRLQGELDDACGGRDTPRVEDTLRLYGVAEMLGGERHAMSALEKLGIGQLRAFQPALDRAKDGSEKWAWSASLTEGQRNGMTALFDALVSGSEVLSGSDTDIAVRRLLCKPVTETAKDGTKTTTTAGPDGSTEVAVVRLDGSTEHKITAADGTVVKAESTPPATAPKAGSTPSATGTRAAGDDKGNSRLPEPTPESPVECAKRIAALLYANPAAVAVVQMVGMQVRWSPEMATALVAGMVEAGHLQAVLAMCQAGIKAHAASKGKPEAAPTATAAAA